MNAKMSGFHQETFSNIQAIKAFDLIPLYVCRLQELQKDYFSMKKKFQMLSGNDINYDVICRHCRFVQLLRTRHLPGVYRGNYIRYNDAFLSLSGSLTSTLNALIAMVPTAVSITTSQAG